MAFSKVRTYKPCSNCPRLTSCRPFSGSPEVNVSATTIGVGVGGTGVGGTGVFVGTGVLVGGGGIVGVGGGGKGVGVGGGRGVTLQDYQSWIFMAGANGVMIGDYLTTQGRHINA